MRKLLFFASVILLSACSSSSFYNLNDVKKELNLSQFPGLQEYEDADAITLKEEHDVVIKLDSDWDLETVENTHVIKKLLKNIEDNASVEIYVSSENKLESVSARTIKPDGTEIILTANDFHTSTGQGDNTTFYSDDKSVKFTFPSIEKNCIVEYKCSVVKKNPFVFDQWRIQRSSPVLKNSYKLTAPSILLTPPPTGAGWQLQYQPYNCFVEPPKFEKNMHYTTSDKDINVSFTWEKVNIPALKPEPYMPAYNDLVQYVKFSRSGWKEWSDISKWYFNYYFMPQLKITPAIIAKSNSLTAGCKDEFEKLQKIYSYVQHMRYIFIKLGEGGGIRPNFPETILQRQYGDCKDKSMLLISLLKVANIKANPVLALTADDGTLDTTFPNANFNHMISKVTLSNGKTFFLDATADYCRIGELPALCEDINVLAINSDGTGSVEKTPGSSYTENVREVYTKVVINEQYEALLNIKYTFNGEYDWSFRNSLKDKTAEEIKKYCKSLVVDDYLNAEILNCRVSSLDSLDKPLTLTFDVKTKDIVNKQGDLVFINVDPFKYSLNMNWLSKTERKYNIEFTYPYTTSKIIEIYYPKNLSLRNLPDKVDIDGSDSQYYKVYTNTDSGKLVLNEKMSIKTKVIPPERYSSFRRTFENLQSKSNEKVVFTSK